MKAPRPQVRNGIVDRSTAAIVREFYQRGLCRVPTEAELQAWQKRLHSDDPAERRQRLEDFAWSLLTSRQFQENH